MSVEGYAGTQGNETFGSEYNSLHSVIMSILSTIHTSTPCEVMGVTNVGTVSPVGLVDIKPLVNQVDGDGNATPHGIIYGVPYFRLQGGSNAIIIDPQVGDIGTAIFAERDISSVIANKGVSNPGSARMFDMSDGIYIGGGLNGTPTQYIQFTTTGITITTPGVLTVNATLAQFNCPVTATGEGTFNGGHTVSQHQHAQGVDSAGNTEQETNKPTG